MGMWFTICLREDPPVSFEVQLPGTKIKKEPAF
jgi:hypothetical protein